MHVRRLSLTDFRSYESVELELQPGASAFVGPNGQGKTNLVEAVDYVATQTSHRVSSDSPLVRAGTGQAIVRTAICRDDRQALVELEINVGAGNRARLNRSPVPRVRDVLGVLRCVLFSPDDLALVKGDPAERRRFLDDLLVARQPRYAGVRSDYDRVLRQRNSLLKSAGGRGLRRSEDALATLEVWDAHLAQAGSELMAARLALVDDLRPHLCGTYSTLAQGRDEPTVGEMAAATYVPSWPLSDEARDQDDLRVSMLAELERRRDDELDRATTLVGPHRDELFLALGTLPARGYASHGESWSMALALRLACFELLRTDGDDPVLVLDDVFAELDELRRARLSAIAASAEQVLVTAAVAGDLPAGLVEQRYDVADGRVSRHA